MAKKTLIYAGVVIALALLTVMPLYILLLTSLKPGTFLPFQEGVFSPDNYIQVFFDAKTYILLGRTFVFAAGSLAFGMTLAIIMAWCVERTDMPFKKYVYVFIFLPLAMPGVIAAIGWTLLLNPSNGILNVFLRELFQLSSHTGPINIYSLGGMMFVAGLTSAPTMFIMLTAVIRNLDPNLEDAAYASGAGGFGVMSKIVLPLLRPGLLSVFIYFMISLIETLEIPLIFGMNAGFHVLSVTVYSLTSGGDSKLPNYGLASTYGMIGMIIGLVLILAYFYMTRKAERYAVVTGKGYKPRLVKLGKWKYAAMSVFFLFFIFKLVLPLLVLVWSSLLPYLQNPSKELLSLLSFNNYKSLFGQAQFVRAVKNTAVLTVVTSIVCMALSTIVAWMIVRGKGVLARLLDMLSFLPHLLPSMIVALALLLLSVGTPLYGTLSVLIIGYVIRYLPFGVRTMTSVLMQISKELEDASYASGASHLQTLRKIVLPLVLPSFVNGIIWVFSHTVRDMTFPLFLISTTNIVFGSLLWQSWQAGVAVETSAITVLLVLLLLVVITPIQLLLERRVERLRKPSR